MIYYWGPRLWYFLHIISYNYPNLPSTKEKEIYKNFFINILPKLIPCEYCTKHYKKHINTINIDLYLHNRNSLVEWVLIAHNNVNSRHNKRTYILSECHYLYMNREINHNKLYSLLKYYSDWAKRARNPSVTNKLLKIIE